MSSSLFPHFRQRFIHESVWSEDTATTEHIHTVDKRKEPLVKMAGLGLTAKGLPGGFGKPQMLNLDALQPVQDDLCLDADRMLQQKREKLAAFDKQCSKVAEGLYVSGKAVAENRQILAENNITHVVNCVGALYPEYFKNDGITYKTLWLQDVPQEDILCILYDTFDFIESARKEASHTAACTRTSLDQQQADSDSGPSTSAPSTAVIQHQGGRVLVHCSQGVSRSTTIAIAYLMWKTGGSYEEIYQTVRALRGVTSPNIGFMCQLMNWAKRRQQPPSRARVYRIAPHCADDPTYLVPKAVSPPPSCSHPDWTTLDHRLCFVVHLPDKLYVWKGTSCHSDMVEAGMRAARGLMRYEGAPAAELVQQGDEPEDLLAALNPSSSSSSSSSNCTRPSSAMISVEPSSNFGTAAAAVGVGLSCSIPQDEEMQNADTVGISSRPNSAQTQQQQQQQQWVRSQQQQPALCTAGANNIQHSSHNINAPSSIGTSSRPMNAATGGTWQQQQHQEQRQGSLSNTPSDTNQLSAQLSIQQLTGGLQGIVTEVPEYKSDCDMFLRAVLKSGGSSSTEAGRLTPRSSLASLVVDDMSAGSGGRSESPATKEGRNRKYRRSETERVVVPSFRQPGRLSASSNPSLWPSGSPSGAAAAAVAPSTGDMHAVAAADVAVSAESEGLAADRRVNSEPAMLLAVTLSQE